MADPDPHPTDADEARRLVERLQAEIAAEADRLRREDPELARVEREIERAWAHVAPPGAVGPSEELLLERVERLSMIDVDAPLGERPGVRQVKGAIRKGTYWYLRYLTDQLNALHNVQARALRRLDERLDRLEAQTGFAGTLDRLVAPADPPSAEAGSALAEAGPAEGPVLVVASGDGAAVGALRAAGVLAYGIDPAPERVLGGIDQGLDLRVAGADEHLATLDDASLGGVVLGGDPLRRPPVELVALLAEVTRVTAPGGAIAVEVEDLAGRDVVAHELLGGRGISAPTWARLLETGGWHGVVAGAVVVARRS